MLKNFKQIIDLLFLINLIYSVSSFKNGLKTSNQQYQSNDVYASNRPVSTGTTPKIDYFNVNVEVCDTRICFPLFGVCTNSNTCHCLKGYANVPGKNNKPFICSYYQKHQLHAFLQELFGIGIGHFYIGQWWIGLLKLIVCFVIPIVLLLVLFGCVYLPKDHDGPLSSESYLLMVTLILLAVIFGAWTIIDGVLFGINFWKDGNGIPLKPW